MKNIRTLTLALAIISLFGSVALSSAAYAACERHVQTKAYEPIDDQAVTIEQSQ